MSTTTGSKWLGGKVPRTAKRTDDDIFGLGIGVTKEERAELKKNDKKTYHKVRENCISGISNKFTQLKSIDENSPIDHFESVYSVVTRFDDLQESLRKSDMLDVFTIASAYNADGSGPTSIATEIDLFRAIKSTDLAIVKLANQYFMEFGDEFHGENIVWSGEKILNSCDTTLRDKLIESTRGWEEKHKGGPTYLKLLMNLIVATSEKSLRSLLDKVAKLKLSDFNGEDVNKAVSFLRGALLILRDNDALPSNFGTLLIKIFKQTSCEDFRSFVGLLEHNVELKIKTITTEETLRLFEQKYTEMLGRNEWTPKSITKEQESMYSVEGGSNNTSTPMMCYNCGALGHGIRTCPQPINQDAINVRKAIIQGGRKSGNSNSKSGNNKSRNNDKKRNSKNKGGAKKGDVDMKKIPPKRNQPHEKTINGQTFHWCGKCAAWTDHKTENHPNAEEGNHVEDEQVIIGDDSSVNKAKYISGASLHF